MVTTCLVSVRAGAASDGRLPRSEGNCETPSRFARFDDYRGSTVVIADDPGGAHDPAQEMLAASRRVTPSMLPGDSREFLRSRVQESGE